MNYKRIYDRIIERAKERVPEGYVERHHIIPRCMGGSDEKDNLVALTPEEHFLCHVLLVKIYPEHSGLIYAVNMMCTGHTGKRKRRKLYGWLKRKYSKQRKLDAKGSGNAQHNTMWINKVGTTENKKIPVCEQIPDGWVKGRAIKYTTTKKLNSTKNVPSKLEKRCISCGLSDCITQFECSKYQLAIRSLHTYFNFDLSVIKTPKFAIELNRVKDIIIDCYHNKNMSIVDITNAYGISSQQVTRNIMNSLNIPRRTKSEALLNYVQNKLN